MLNNEAQNSTDIRTHTSIKLVMTEGLLFESVKLETGVFSASLLALETVVTAVVGVDVTVIAILVTCTVDAAALVLVADVVVLLDGNFFKMSSFAFHPSCNRKIFV